MRAEQIIYTSCRRGIDGNTSGFQNYSYSPRMHDWITAGNGIGVMQSYQPPSRSDYPALPTKEEAQSLYPRRKCFGMLPGPDALYGMAVCSYIGRDYPEGSVRGGNFISHATALPATSMTRRPCEFLTSSSFLTWLDAETARQDSRPEPLTSLDITPGEGNGIDDVREFLAEDDHAETIAQLFESLITAGDGDFVRKIIINASEEEFALWIAALQYMLPVRQSLNYGFSTYEYDPLRSPFHVIRAVDGMRGSLTDSTFSYFDVFDMEQGTTPQREYDEALDAFVEFAVTLLRYSQDGLDSFHAFLDSTTYTKLDSQLVAAYDLYRITVGSQPVTTLDANHLTACVNFAAEYGTSSQRALLAQATLHALVSEQHDAAWCESATNALMQLVKAEPALGAEGRDTVVCTLAHCLSSGNAPRAFYNQVHTVGERLFQANNADVDVALFHAIDGDAMLTGGDGASGATNETLPWSVSIYADLVTSALIDGINRGVHVPLGVPGRQMVTTFHGDVPNAVLRLVNTITQQANPSVGVALLTRLVQLWQPHAELVVMLSLLVIEQGASDEVEQVAVQTLSHVFSTSTADGRVYCCRSLLADGRTDIVRRFIDEVCASIDIMHGAQSHQLTSEVRSLCEQLHMAVPNVVLLAEQQDCLAQLAALHGQRHPDPAVMAQLAHTIQRQGAVLPMVELAPNSRQQYVEALAQPLAEFAADSVSDAALQLTAVPESFTGAYMQAVFVAAAMGGDAERTLRLLTVDAAMLSTDNPGSSEQVVGFATHCAKAIDGNQHVDVQALARIADDPKRKQKLADHYRKTLGKTFPERTFDTAWEAMAEVLGDQQGRGGILEFLRRIFGF